MVITILLAAVRLLWLKPPTSVSAGGWGWSVPKVVVDRFSPLHQFVGDELDADSAIGVDLSVDVYDELSEGDLGVVVHG